MMRLLVFCLITGLTCPSFAVNYYHHVEQLLTSAEAKMTLKETCKAELDLAKQQVLAETINRIQMSRMACKPTALNGVEECYKWALNEVHKFSNLTTGQYMIATCNYKSSASKLECLYKLTEWLPEYRSLNEKCRENRIFSTNSPFVGEEDRKSELACFEQGLNPPPKATE